jgi:hypothetical protein
MHAYLISPLPSQGGGVAGRPAAPVLPAVETRDTGARRRRPGAFAFPAELALRPAVALAAGPGRRFKRGRRIKLVRW